tara:strand:- start:1654 stop:2955 length:1302 start_codon:yes stop_codon:yes gene_type:complete
MAHIGKYNISSYVNDLIPEHVATSYPDLIEFIKVYALYLERQNKSGFYLNALDIQRDIDEVEETLLTELQNEIGIAVPRDFATDPRMFYKHLIEFYRSRGTPESITSFFRTIYDDEVETYFPYIDLLVPSDGDWTDQAADIKINQSKYTPWNTFTISGTPTVVSGNNDAGNSAFFDDDIVFVNDVYKTPGTDYAEGVYSESSTTKYKLTFTSALANSDVVKTYPKGLFTTANGFLSDRKYIQDSYYYQKFSYVLKTGKNISDWKNAFTRLIHPAGFIFFGEVSIFIQLLTSTNDEVQPGWLAAAGLININIAQLQIGPVSFHEVGSYLEKTWTYFARGSSEFSIIGMQNHWDNMKFRYLGPNSNFAHYTLQDAINNNIRIQHNQEVMKLTCDTVAVQAGEPYTSTYTRPYIVNGVNQNSDITYYVQDCTSTYS